LADKGWLKLNKEQKEKEIAVLKEKLARSKHVIVADHTGIDVEKINVFRKKLKEADSELRVAKNTFLKLAVKDTDLEDLAEHFVGPTSLIFGYDEPMAPAKVVRNSIKEIEKPQFKAYYYEGKLHEFDTFKMIADLPPKEQVLAALVSTVEAPISKFISLIDAATSELIGTIDALAESRS
jgi:large subunit ribosomal protein L10